MRIKEDIDLDLIDMDRIPLDEKSLNFAILLRQRGRNTFPAIKLAKKSNGRFSIRDGRHRWLAHKLNGESKIYAKFSLKPLKELVI